MIGARGMTSLRRWLARRLGLRARMTASYVLVTFAAVIVVEALAAALVIPDVNREADLASRVVNTAHRYTKEYGSALGKATVVASDPAAISTTVQPDGTVVTIKGVTVAQLSIQILRQQGVGDAGVHLGPGQVRTQDQGVLIPRVEKPLPDSAPMSLLLVVDPRGVVLGSSY